MRVENPQIVKNRVRTGLIMRREHVTPTALSIKLTRSQLIHSLRQRENQKKVFKRQCYGKVRKKKCENRQEKRNYEARAANGSSS